MIVKILKSAGSQFHAIVSTKYREHTKEELTRIGEMLMDKMGYKNQPYLIVFHNDTENNHIHIVSTRVNKETGKKINDSFEKLKSQRALTHIMEKAYGFNAEQKLEELLKYQFSSKNQCKILLEKNGFKTVQRDGILSILKNGNSLKTIREEDLDISNEIDARRAKQLSAIIRKYKAVYANEVFKVLDDRKEKGLFARMHKQKDKIKIAYESELQQKLKEKFGIEITFHHKDGQTPFGYTLIDHKNGQVFKGSQVLKMKDVFEFTPYQIDKKLFESLQDFNITSDKEKDLLQQVFPQIERFMLFENKQRKSLKEYNQIRDEVKNYLKGGDVQGVFMLQGKDGETYVFNHNHHHIEELESLVGSTFYNRYKNGELDEKPDFKQDRLKENTESMIDILLKGSYTEKDPWENKLKKKRKKKTK